MVAQAKPQEQEPQEQETVETLHISLEVDVDAPLDVAFEALLLEIGPECTQPNGTAMPFKLEAWPGGRWYRDLGGNTGHLWGHVQVIKPPKLIELCGPLFMSYPAQNFVQYRLTPAGDGTHLTMTHRAIGLIPAEHAAAVSSGWTHMLKRIKEIAEDLRKTR